MALLFMDGFSNYNAPSVGALGKWQAYQQSGTRALSIVGAGGRNGNSSLHLAAGTNNAYMQGVLGSSIPRVILGVAVKVNVFDLGGNEVSILQFEDGSTNQVVVSMLTNGQIRFRQGTGTGGGGGSRLTGTILATSVAPVLTATGTYFFLEFDITFNSASGAIILHLNGANVPLSASSGLNTAPSGNNSFNTYQLGAVSDGGAISASYDFSDFYLASSTGGNVTTFVGDAKVLLFLPTGAGLSTQFSPNGAATDWQCVNEASEDGDTTYASDATVGQKDLYAHAASPANTGQIFGVQLDSVTRKDDAGGRSLANTMSSGGTAADGASHALSQTYAWYLDIFENDPNTSAPWIKAALDAMQFGPKVAA